MPAKPTYEELEQEVVALQKQIAENRYLENKQCTSDALCRLLFENSIFLIAYLSPDGIILSMNKVFAARFKGLPEDFTGKSIHELFRPEVAEDTMKRIREVVSSGEGQVYENFIELPLDDQWFTMELEPVKNTAGEIIGVQLVSQDITRHKKNEEQIAIFQKIAEKSGQSFGMMDLKGNFTYVNPALCRHLGETEPKNAISKNIASYHSEDHSRKLQNECLPAVMEHGQWTGELYLVSINGKITHTIQHLFLIRDTTSQPFFIADIVTDITAHDRFNKVLMQKEKLETLGAIAAEVSHEIRNPLVSIGGFARRLKAKFSDVHECDIILKESQRLEKILSRIRNYLDPMELHPEECRVDAILHECLQNLAPELNEKQVTYNLQLIPAMPSIFADRQVISQIFVNLIRNAKEVMNPGGVLDIRAFESDQDVQIEFKNHAPNYQTRYTDSIFIPFSEGNGGMELPLCYRLLKDMGGILSFVQDNGSSVFTVSIPKTTQVMSLKPKEKVVGGLR